MIFVKKLSKIYSWLLVAGMGLVMFSCGNANMDRKDKVAAIIGTLKDPFLGVTFTPQVLIDKSGMTDGAMPFTYEAFATFFMSEDKTGIDNKEQVQIVVENSGGMMPNIFAFIPLKSEGQFKKLVEKELGAKVSEKNGAHYFRKDDDQYIVAWKGDLAIVSNIPFSLDNLFSKGTTESKKAAIRLVNLLNEVSKKNISQEFRDFFDKEGDMRLYANGQSAYELIESMRFVSKKDKAELKSLLSGTTLETALNFETGSIDLNIDYFLADSLKMYANIMREEGVSTDLLKYGLTDEPMMAFSMNMSPENFVRLMKRQRDLMDTKGLEKSLKELNLTLDDLPKIFTGEVVVMMDGMDSTLRSYTSYEGELVEFKNYEPRVATIVGLKDVTKMQEILKKLAAPYGDSNRVENMFYHFNNQHLILVSSMDWLTVIKNGNGKTITTSVLSENSAGLYINPRMGEKLDFDMEAFGIIQNEMTDLVAKITKTGSHISIKLQDNNKNALRTILEHAIEEFEKNEKSLNSDIEEILNDELMDKIESEVEAGVQEIVNSKEMDDLKNAIKAF